MYSDVHVLDIAYSRVKLNLPADSCEEAASRMRI